MKGREMVKEKEKRQNREGERSCRAAGGHKFSKRRH